MGMHDTYNAILDLVLEKGNTTANNVKHFLPGFAAWDPAKISLILEDMYRLQPKAFDLKHRQGGQPVLVKNMYTHLIKESGGFEPFLQKREASKTKQAVIFQKANGSSPLADLHPTVQRVANDLFEDGHFRQAILDTYIAIEEEVKAKSGINKTGTALMQTVFSSERPVLITADDVTEREGFMHLFKGAVLAIRNPKAHKLIPQTDPQRTLEWLSFASVLLRILDETQTALPSANNSALSGE